MCSFSCVAPLDQCHRNGNGGVSDREEHGGNEKTAPASLRVIAGEKVKRDKTENEGCVMRSVLNERLECFDREDLKRKGESHAEAEDQKEVARADGGKRQRQDEGEKIKDDHNARRIYRAAAQNMQCFIHWGAPFVINAHILAYFRAHCKY